MKKLTIAMAVAVLLGAICGSASAQVLREKMDEGRKALEGIIAYPPETRLAILEVCTKPDLIVEMGKTGKLPDISAYPESVQKAAKDLAEYPDIIQTLNNYIGIATVVGRFYERTGGETLGLTDRLAAKLEEQENAQKAKWLELLQANQQALEQFGEAVQALNEAQAAAPAAPTGAAPAAPAPAEPVPEEPLPPEEGYAEESYPPDPSYQAEVSEGGAVTVYSGPTGEMVDYLLENADEYAAAAAAALDYWQQYQEGALAEQILSDVAGLADVGELIANPQLLGEIAGLRKEFPKAKERLTEHQDRIQNIAGRRGQFKNLAQRVDRFADKNPQHRVNQWRQNPRAASRKPTARRSKRPQTRRRATSARSGNRNRRQRTNAARNRHRKSWSGMSRGRSGGRSRGRSGGGRSRSGGRRSGGGGRRGGGGGGRRR